MHLVSMRCRSAQPTRTVVGRSSRTELWRAGRPQKKEGFLTISAAVSRVLKVNVLRGTAEDIASHDCLWVALDHGVESKK